MDAYEPISCDFHDILEDAATRRLRVEVAFSDENGGEQVLIDRIKDITVEGQEEFLILAEGQKIRLDRITRVDQQQAANYEGGMPDDAVEATPERPLMKQ